MAHERRARDMAGRELIARKRRRAEAQKVDRQILALDCEIVACRIKAFDNAQSVFESYPHAHVAGVFSSCALVHARSGSNCSDFVNASRACAFW